MDVIEFIASHTGKSGAAPASESSSGVSGAPSHGNASGPELVSASNQHANVAGHNSVGARASDSERAGTSTPEHNPDRSGHAGTGAFDPEYADASIPGSERADASNLGPDCAGHADANPALEQPKQELATFRLLYETSRLCLFETRDGRITAVPISRLA